MLFLKQPLIWPFFRYKSAAARQIDSNKLSNSKLKLDLWNRVKSEKSESRAPPSIHTNGAQFFGTPYRSIRSHLLYKVI